MKWLVWVPTLIGIAIIIYAQWPNIKTAIQRALKGEPTIKDVIAELREIKTELQQLRREL